MTLIIDCYCNFQRKYLKQDKLLQIKNLDI